MMFSILDPYPQTSGPMSKKEKPNLNNAGRKFWNSSKKTSDQETSSILETKMRAYNFNAHAKLKACEMNRLEKKYSERLERQLQMGEILWWKFEGVKLRLADKTFLSPDFAVVDAKGEFQMHEVKGYMHDEANTKLKIAAGMYPFTFFLCKWKSSQWEVVEV